MCVCLIRQRRESALQKLIIRSYVLVQAHVGSFYMGKFNGPTPKRHKLWSNDAGLVNGVLEEAGYMSKEEMKRCRGSPLVKKYIDKKGVKRCIGIKANLRSSQNLARNYFLLPNGR